MCQELCYMTLYKITLFNPHNFTSYIKIPPFKWQQSEAFRILLNLQGTYYMPGTIILVLEIENFKWDIKFEGAEERKQKNTKGCVKNR